MDAPPLYNINVGVLGHVDSGKTSLVAALSTTLSTAALDKHPQSRERGITLDLGFSSFTAAAPPALAAALAGEGRPPPAAVQVTLVDCPGHASLIRTVIGGAQIVDAALLVVDAVRGIQPQTAECIVLAEVAVPALVVALNKVDLFPPDKRDKYARRAARLVAAALAGTRFAGCPIVAVSARPSAGGSWAGDAGGSGAAGGAPPQPPPPPVGVPELVAALLGAARPRRARAAAAAAPFLMHVDHCFAVKGAGTVLTGTVAAGTLRVGDELELPALGARRRVRSLQAFRVPVAAAGPGDRVGVGVAALDAAGVERALAAAPGSVRALAACVAAVARVRFHAGAVRSRARMHVVVGHQAVVAELLFFSRAAGGGEARPAQPAQGGADDGEAPAFDFGAEYLYEEELLLPPEGGDGEEEEEARDPRRRRQQWALVRFDEPVWAPPGALLVGARLDAPVAGGGGGCRLALSGRVAAAVEPSPEGLRRLRVFRPKHREGAVERVDADGCGAVCRGAFDSAADAARCAGAEVRADGGAVGVVEGAFGQSGKFRARFPGGVAPRRPDGQPTRVRLDFKRFLFDGDRRRGQMLPQ